MLVDVSDGIFQAPRHCHRHLVVQKLFRKIPFFCLSDARGYRSRGFVAHKLHSPVNSLVQSLRSSGQELLSHIGVHQQRLGSIAHRRTLRLGIHQNLQSHVQIGGAVDIDVTVAVAVDDVRHGGVLQHRLDETFATSGDEAVNIAFQLHELGCRFMGGVFHQQKRIFRQASFGKRLSERGCDGDIGFQSH